MIKRAIELIAEPDMKEQLSQNIARLARPEAAENIARAVLDLKNKQMKKFFKLKK